MMANEISPRDIKGKLLFVKRRKGGITTWGIVLSISCIVPSNQPPGKVYYVKIFQLDIARAVKKKMRAHPRTSFLKLDDNNKLVRWYE